MNPSKLFACAIAAATAVILPLSLVGPVAQAVPPPPTPPFPLTAVPDGLGVGAGLPVIAESPGEYVPQSSCDPREKPGITKFRKLVMRHYHAGANWGSTRICTADGISEHLEGRAWDWNANVNNPKQFHAAANLLQWLTEAGPDGELGYNARRLGIMYIGYNYRIWGVYRAGDGWRVLQNENGHTDHVHFSFTWSGAMARTSFWTGQRGAEDYGPCRPYAGQPAVLHSGPQTQPCARPPVLPAQYSGAKLLWWGSSGALVKKAQRRLHIRRNGSFGGSMQRAVARYQVAHSLPRTGAIDAVTFYSLDLNH